MEIQSNIAPSSLLDGLAPKTGTSARDDLFASMMDRLLAEAATRRRELAQAGEAERRAPVRPERPKPLRGDYGQSQRQGRHVTTWNRALPLRTGA